MTTPNLRKQIKWRIDKEEKEEQKEGRGRKRGREGRARVEEGKVHERETQFVDLHLREI